MISDFFSLFLYRSSSQLNSIEMVENVTNYICNINIICTNYIHNYIHTIGWDVCGQTANHNRNHDLTSDRSYCWKSLSVPPLLCPHDCARTRLCPDRFVPTRLSQYMTVPRHICTQTRLCPDTFVPRHVCAHA